MEVLSAYIYPFLIVKINIPPLISDSLQWVLPGRPLLKGSIFCQLCRRAKQLGVCRETQQKVVTRSPSLYPLDSACAVLLSWQEGAQPEPWEVWRASTLLGDLLGSGTPTTATSCFKERCHVKQKSRKKSWRRQFLACSCRQLHPDFWRIYLSQTCTQAVGLHLGLPTCSCVIVCCIGCQVKHTGTNGSIEPGQPGS